MADTVPTDFVTAPVSTIFSVVCFCQDLHSMIYIANIVSKNSSNVTKVPLKDIKQYPFPTTGDI